jgi:heme-degrading monooxygenase HmoA
VIIRIFQVSIHPEYRSDFERDFNSLSIDSVHNQRGLISCQVGGPTRTNPDDYLMVTCWEDEESLVAFAGEDWNQAVVPVSMRNYPRTVSVVHYQSMAP